MAELAPKAGGGFFGRLAMGLLPVVILSGVWLAALWSADAPRASTEAIAAGLPWAWLLRGVHFMASTGLVLATGVHTLLMLRRRRERSLSPAVWWRSTLLLPVVVLAALGGFVMRGDAEAVAAWQVWRGILESMPFVGDALARLLLGLRGDDLASDDLGAVALHHGGTFTLAAWLLSTEHGRRLWPDVRATVQAAALCLALAAVVPLPLSNTTDGATLLLGPWFLLGLQGALLDLPAAAGWLVPLLAFVALGAVRHVHGLARKALLTLLAGAFALNLMWTVRLLWSMGAA